MAVVLKTEPKPLLSDKSKLLELAHEVNARAGITGGRTMTIEELQRYQVEFLGIRPEDNGASRELLRMRYGDDDDPDTDEA